MALPRGRKPLITAYDHVHPACRTPAWLALTGSATYAHGCPLLAQPARLGKRAAQLAWQKTKSKIKLQTQAHTTKTLRYATPACGCPPFLLLGGLDFAPDFAPDTEENVPRWDARSSKPGGAAMPSRVGSTPALFRHLHAWRHGATRAFACGFKWRVGDGRVAAGWR